MTALLLSAHNDDETLFASYICQREHPHVVVVLRSFTQETGRERRVHYTERENETACAMNILGCTWEQWHQPDTDPDWEEIAAAISELGGLHDRVYAPLPESEGGHPHHDALGATAARLWPDTHFYSTYRNGRERSQRGTIVTHTYEWERRKMEAMSCYQSQLALWSTQHHFESAAKDPTEYEVLPPSTL